MTLPDPIALAHERLTVHRLGLPVLRETDKDLIVIRALRDEVERLRESLASVRAEERARCVILIRQKYGVTNRAADWLARQEVQ